MAKIYRQKIMAAAALWRPQRERKRRRHRKHETSVAAWRAIWRNDNSRREERKRNVMAWQHKRNGNKRRNIGGSIRRSLRKHQ